MEAVVGGYLAGEDKKEERNQSYSLFLFNNPQLLVLINGSLTCSIFPSSKNKIMPTNICK